MALDKDDLAQAIIDALAGIDDPSDANTELGKAISTYIKDNAEIDYSWAGTFTPPPPALPVIDTVTTTTGEFTLLEMVLTPSNLTNPSLALVALQTQLILGMTSALHNVTATGFTTAPGSIAPAPTLGTLNISINVTGDEDDVQKEAMTQMADSIIQWVTGLVSAPPLAGSHATFIGTPGAIMTGIS